MAKDIAFPGLLTKGGTTVGSAKVIRKPELTTTEVRLDGMDSDYTIKTPGGKRNWSDVACTVICAGSELIDVYNDVVNESVEACVLTDPHYSYTFSGWYKSAAPNESNNDATSAVELDLVIGVSGDVIVTEV